MQARTQWTHSDVLSQLATTREWSFEIGDRQNAKRQWNSDRRAIYNARCCIDAGRGVIRHRGVSDGSDRVRPLWRSHSARTEYFFANDKARLYYETGPILSSLTPQTVYIRMSPQMCSEMNSIIWSQSNNRCWFINHVGIFALAVAFPSPWRLPFGDIAVSWKWIYIRGITIMIRLHVSEASPEGTYKVV